MEKSSEAIRPEARSAPGAGTVVVYADRTDEAEHEWSVHLALGQRLARLLGLGFGGRYDPHAPPAGPLYFVPINTLVGLERARQLGIRGEQDLFGGVVPHAFIATKSITHPLISAQARTVPGWSGEFARRAGEAVLAGFTAFDLEDARRAGLALLERGRLRIKSVRANAGRGQWSVASREELDAVLEKADPEEVGAYGLVLEEDLSEVETYSVGQVRVGRRLASYYGTQRLTEDNQGAQVYGGTDLLLVEGGFDALLGLDLPEPVRLAVQQARIYDAAASGCFPGLIASRRNYDIAQGRDAQGRRRSGVLEQSWRIGGASSAEIVALEALAGGAGGPIRASSLELYGRQAEPPEGAVVLFRGEDPQVGHITKCVRVESHGD